MCARHRPRRSCAVRLSTTTSRALLHADGSDCSFAQGIPDSEPLWAQRSRVISSEPIENVVTNRDAQLAHARRLSADQHPLAGECDWPPRQTAVDRLPGCMPRSRALALVALLARGCPFLALLGGFRALRLGTALRPLPLARGTGVAVNRVYRPALALAGGRLVAGRLPEWRTVRGVLQLVLPDGPETTVSHGRLGATPCGFSEGK